MTKLLCLKELSRFTEIKPVYIYLNSGKYKVVLCLLVPLCSSKLIPCHLKTVAFVLVHLPGRFSSEGINTET